MTLNEIVCENVDWINLALHKYFEGIKHFSFHEGVESVSKVKVSSVQCR